MQAAVLIDAFAGRRARGNRAAVIMCEALPPVEAMQARAAEIGAPATAFVSGNADLGAYLVRWFDAKREIALCGHGALAAGSVLLERIGESEVKLGTSDRREVLVRKTDGEARYEMCLPSIETQSRDWPELVEALGATPKEIRWNPAGYAIVVLETAATVRALRPDFAAISALGNLQVSATAPGEKDCDFVSRVFSGEREDAATGSAHAMLTPYWCAKLERTQLSAFQASTNGGRIECRIEGESVWLSGECRAVT